MNTRLSTAFLLSSVSLVALALPTTSWATSVTANLAITVTSAGGGAGGNEEFVGPFASWKNVKTVYGAVGDGAHDDTSAIQSALNALQSGSATTIYFPAGAYKISSTLNLHGAQRVNIVGHDPADTTIIWAGASGSTMLNINGVAYSRFDRLTFNGQNSAGIVVDQSWDGNGSTGNFDTGNQYADVVFENTGIAYRCGALGNGCSETALLRDKFLNNTIAGVSLANYNALDIWVWYSTFQNNARGITNTISGPQKAGNFHVFNSVFQNSSVADISIGNTGVFNIRNNYSSGSNQFFTGGATGNPAGINMTGNTILDTTQSQTVSVGNLGPITAIDNVIRSNASVSSGPVINGYNNNFTTLFSMGNTFTATSPVSATGHLHSINDQIVSRGMVNPSPPPLPGTPPNNGRQIFEVTAGSSASQIQSAINSAASAGSRAVVHIQPGNYSINATLTLPANSDIQIIGDGYNSHLSWSGGAGGPVLRLNGPSKVVLREFSIWANNNAEGIEINAADETGGRIWMEQANLGSSQTNLFVDALDRTSVELHDFNHVYTNQVSGGGTSVIVTGGPSAAAGTWLGGNTTIFSGATAGNVLDCDVSAGAHLNYIGVWHDGGAGNGTCRFTGPYGQFTYANGVNYQSTSPTLNLNNVQATAALLGVFFNSASVSVSGDGTGGRVLGLGLVGPTASFFSNSSSAGMQLLTSQTMSPPGPGTATSQIGETSLDANFLAAALNEYRSTLSTTPGSSGAGITNVQAYRVTVSNATRGMHLKK
jgi:hypothetical protein